MITLIGIILLMGLVTKNAILLVDSPTRFAATARIGARRCWLRARFGCDPS